MGFRFLVLPFSLLVVLAPAGVSRSVGSQASQKSRGGSPKGILTSEYAWQDFARVQRKCRFEIPQADLAASEAEFGADPEDMKPFEIRMQREITVTSEQARDPQVMARLKKQAQAEVDKQAKAALEARRNKLVLRGFLLIDETNVTVDLGKLWRWNLKRMQPHARRLAASANPKDTPAGAALAFVQEIPYRKPPDERAGRCTLGFLPPLEALAAGYGDCDTKSLLFASLADMAAARRSSC